MPEETEKLPKKPVRISTLADLKRILDVPRCFQFTMDKGSPSEAQYEIEMRALTADEVAEIDKLTRNIRPPSKEKNGITTYNDDDPEYLEKMRQANRKKRVAYFEMGLKGFGIPGENADEKAAYLYREYPIGVIEAIYGALQELTGDPFKDALFTSTAS